jgi:hypothetical protein
VKGHVGLMSLKVKVWLTECGNDMFFGSDEVDEVIVGHEFEGSVLPHAVGRRKQDERRHQGENKFLQS